MATVELDDVRKSFGRTEVIHGVDAAIRDGEFIVIVGPSGCGKSTLLRMVAGLETVSQGEIRIEGERVNEREPMDRDIAMVFQSYALYPHMSVRQNMAYGLRIAGTPRPEIERRVGEAARLLQIEDYLDRRPRQLSGGQRQRVAMGRAIVRSPKVFLFDEPLSNLDAKLRVAMRLEIKGLQERLGVTSLYVTHDQVEAMTMADRMIVMNAGNVEQMGSPLDVYERPASLFAAQFIGSPAMNVLRGEATGAGVRLADGTSLDAPAAASGAVDVGLRPEHVRPDPDGPLAFHVRAAEPLGASTLLHGALGADGVPFVAALPGIHHVGRGGADAHETIRLAVQPGALHLFDPKTGTRL